MLYTKNKCFQKYFNINAETNIKDFFCKLENFNKFEYFDNYTFPDVVRNRTLENIKDKYDSNFNMNDIFILENRLKIYLAACSMSASTIEMADKYVDELWHNFILYTKEYIQFCLYSFDKFIHHKPYNEEKKLFAADIKNIAIHIKKCYSKYRKDNNFDLLKKENIIADNNIYNNLLFTDLSNLYIEDNSFKDNLSHKIDHNHNDNNIQHNDGNGHHSNCGSSCGSSCGSGCGGG